jgi:hypothetical protein
LPADSIGLVVLAREDVAKRRAEVDSALAGVAGVKPVADEGLRRALAGESADPAVADGEAALARAQTAFGALDCMHARGEADRAVLGLAAAQAAGLPVGDGLRRAHTIRLLCADQGGDRGVAQSAATALRRLNAGDPPAGVGDAVWARYPALDAATGVQNGRLAITSQPDGAALWIDHAPAGKAPSTVSLAEGEHLVAAALPSGASTARRVTVAPSWAPAPLALVISGQAAARWREVEAAVRSWRSGTRLTPAALGETMARAGLAYAVVLDPRGKLAVWHRRPGRAAASHLGNAAQPGEIGAIVASSRGPGIDPDRELLRETPVERQADGGEKRQEWWVYAAIIGAVAIGAGIVVAQDLGDDRQRIEIDFP